ncbi:hypothetical protein MBLNU459_g4814t1 [Dothideomycetes sp. NU459]
MCRVILRKQIREGTNQVTNVRVVEKCKDAVGDTPCVNTITINEGREHVIKEVVPSPSSPSTPRPIVHQRTTERYFKPELTVSLEGGRPRYSLERSSTGTQLSRAESSPGSPLRRMDVPPEAPSPPLLARRPGSSRAYIVMRSPASTYVRTATTPSSSRGSDDVSSLIMPPPLRPLLRHVPRQNPREQRLEGQRPGLTIRTAPTSSSTGPSLYSPGLSSYARQNLRNHDSAYYSHSGPPSSGVPSPTAGDDEHALREQYRELARQKQRGDDLRARNSATPPDAIDADVAAQRREALDRLEGRRANDSPRGAERLNRLGNYYYDDGSYRARVHDDNDEDEETEDELPPTLPPLSRQNRERARAARARDGDRQLGDPDETARTTQARMREAEERMDRDEESVRSGSVRSSGGTGRGKRHRRRHRSGETQSEAGSGSGFGSRLRDLFRP